MFEFRDVVVRLGGQIALEVAELGLGEATTVALIGPNGSGKTTLLRLVAGLLSPSAGAITGSGASVAYVAQHQAQHPWMPLTVREVLQIGRYRDRGLLGRINKSDRHAISEAAERLDVSDLLDRRLNDLSGGQRQRVLIAGALAGQADCLLLDEPITGLDLPSQMTILDAVEAERQRGRLVMLSTHHLSEARQCTRVLVLANRIVADGPPETALQREPLAEAFGLRVLGDDALVLDDHGHDHHHHHGHSHHHEHEPVR